MEWALGSGALIVRAGWTLWNATMMTCGVLQKLQIAEMRWNANKKNKK